MKIKTFLIASTMLCLLPSCSTKRSDLTYFKDIDSFSQSFVVSPDDYVTTIQPDDELMITVNSHANPIVSSTYNLPQSNPAHVKDGASIQ
ncbi:MAG: hypothetical protein K2K84_10100, partial [Muribaculaceae bacterium]|nr:hypothetical protein [Muribaculaceae bacterium]